MSEEIEVRQPKIGEGHLAAMVRAGQKELTQALVAFPESNIRPVEEPGLVGNPTPQIVTAEMGAGYRDMLDQASSRASVQDDRGMER